MPTDIIRVIEDCGEIIQFEDGFFHYAPRGGGGIPSRVLRIIADHLDDKNAVWDEICKFAGAPDRLNPMWEEGLKRIDSLIVKLQAKGWEIHGGDDGGDTVMKCPTRKAAIELVASVDRSTLFFKRGKTLCAVMVIPGNGEDAICDHSTQAEFVADMDTIML